MGNSYNLMVDLSTLDPLIQEETQREVAGYESDTTNAMGLKDVVNIADKGVLTGVSGLIQVFTAEGYMGLRVTVDGVLLGPLNYLFFTKIGDSRTCCFNHRFNISLQVQINMSAADLGTGNCTVWYTTD